jgi:hypothetical protein
MNGEKCHRKISEKQSNGEDIDSVVERTKKKATIVLRNKEKKRKSDNVKRIGPLFLNNKM